MLSSRRKFIYCASVGLMVPFVAPTVAASTYLPHRRKAWRAGAPPAWYDDITLAEDTGAEEIPTTGIVGVRFTVASGGTGTKIRVGLTYVFANATLKAAVYDGSGNLISGLSGSIAVLSSGGNDQVVEITGLSGTIAAGQISIALSASAGTALYLGTVATGGAGLITFDDDYADMPVAAVSGYGAWGQRGAAGVYF